MVSHGFQIDITQDSVDVKLDPEANAMEFRAAGGILTLGAATFFWFLLVFLPGRHEQKSLWTYLTKAAPGTEGFYPALIAVLLLTAIFGGIFLFGVRSFLPSEQSLHADHSSLTISTIPLFTLNGTQKIQTFLMEDISELQFVVIRLGLRDTVSRLCFDAKGKRYKTLKGIEPPEASIVLDGLRALGAHVPHDPDLPARVEEKLRLRKEFGNN